ncbi:MAG: hypothetical protein LAN59_14320 [Acidobacteriia bacterium]|nr:hypothetical protein [Terriglobia bacterium]
MKKARFLLLSGLWLSLFWLSPNCLAQSLKPGTQIKVRLLGKLDTGANTAGQTFTATVGEAVRSGGRTIFAKDTRVKGQILEVVSSGRLKKPASISLQLTSIGRNAVETETLRIDGKSHAGRDAAWIGGGAATGAVIGAIAGGGKGAAIGTLAGAGAGTGTAYATGKKEIVLPAETELVFVVAGNHSSMSEEPAPRNGSGSFARSQSYATQEPSGRSEVYVEEEPSRPPQARRYRDDDRDEDEDSESYERPESSRGRRHSRDADRDDSASLSFSEHDQRIIHSYFRSNSRNLPPGLAKRNGDLPPGLEKHLRRDGTLPPGLQKRVEPFPEDLDDRLPALPRGYSRVFLSGRAIILARDGRIADLIEISW